uniref:Uncharacterized protein n=1 Tax=Anopheles dirus TaxID=7168 RepID=A0A182NXU4_9DIPT
MNQIETISRSERTFTGEIVLQQATRRNHRNRNSAPTPSVKEKRVRRVAL